MASLASSLAFPLGAAPNLPPTVENFQPTPGTPIGASQALSFDVKDDSGTFRRVFVEVTFAALGTTEVIHDGDVFRGLYAAGSARTPIPKGYRYTCVRAGGWPAPPEISVFAIDRAGLENT